MDDQVIHLKNIKEQISELIQIKNALETEIHRRLTNGEAVQGAFLGIGRRSRGWGDIENTMSKMRQELSDDVFQSLITLKSPAQASKSIDDPEILESYIVTTTTEKVKIVE